MTAAPGRETRRFRAPGRVNLMGDHTDYNEGFVLPLAIDRECVIAARPAERVRVQSRDEQTAVEIAADGSDEPARVEPEWGRYVAGVVRALAERGRAARGIDAVLASSVPRGSGLSSSAALEERPEPGGTDDAMTASRPGGSTPAARISAATAAR